MCRARNETMLEEKAVDILNQMEALTKQFAPDVVDAGMEVTRLNGIASVVAGVVMLICAYPVYTQAVRLFLFFKKKKEEDGYMSDWEMGSVAVSICAPVVIILLVIFGAALVFDVWNWVAIFNPKLALAKSIMGKM